MPPFETAGIWKRTLAPQGDRDKFADIRERLRSAYLAFRERARLLAAEIARDLPDYTVHDITHIDSLWHLADLIAGEGISLTPAEAFVLGGAFLIHDLGNGLAAYPDGIATLRSSPIWDDAIALAVRNDLNRAPAPEELTSPESRRRKGGAGRRSEAAACRTRGKTSLRFMVQPDSGERYHLIEDPFLRLHFGKLIGRIAHSHWWPARNLISEFGSILGPPSGFRATGLLTPSRWLLFCECPMQRTLITRALRHG